MYIIRFLIILSFLCPAFSQADQFGFDYNSSPNSDASYGLDYEFVKSGSYIDLAVSANSSGYQPYVSVGLQGDVLNVGLASSVFVDRANIVTPSAGPEVGFSYNLTPLVYFKENANILMDQKGNKSYGFTLSLGLNL